MANIRNTQESQNNANNSNNIKQDQIYNEFDYNLDFKQENFQQNELAYGSNLPLQIALYYNAFFYPIWFGVQLTMLITKFQSLVLIFQICACCILSIMTLVEFFRIFLGYTGNLNEAVHSLTGFWILTLVIQLPLGIMLIAMPPLKATAFEISIQIIHLIFLAFESIFGFFAVKTMIKLQKIKFHMLQFQREYNDIYPIKGNNYLSEGSATWEDGIMLKKLE